MTCPDVSGGNEGERMKMKRDVPEPSAADAGPVVVVPMLQSARLALYQAMRGEGLNNVTLARKLGLVEGEVRRMLDLDHQTRDRHAGKGVVATAKLTLAARMFLISSQGSTSIPEWRIQKLRHISKRHANRRPSR
jgi:hypothetical protein